FALVILTAACDSDDDNGASAPTGTAVLTPSGAVPGVSPSVAVPPMPPATITPDNFGALEVVYERGLEAPQFMAWQEDGRLLVASHAAALLIDPEAGTAD